MQFWSEVIYGSKWTVELTLTLGSSLSNPLQNLCVWALVPVVHR